MFLLDGYQEDFIGDIGDALITHNAIIAQLTTGGGKTVCFATICKRFIELEDKKGLLDCLYVPKDIIIFVHRRELLEQTRKTLFNWYGIISQEVSADTKHFTPYGLHGKTRVYVAMVETFNNRSKKASFLHYMKDIGLVIIDEAHLSNFKKIFLHFPLALRIGFTGTPIAATKKDPLLNYYTEIVVGPSIKFLIEYNKKNPGRGVVQDLTYCLTNVNRQELLEKCKEAGKGGEDIDADIMGSEFSKKRQIQNTIDAYIKYAFGKKMLCFNANVAHSELQTREMVKAGLNARHLDGTAGIEYREACFNWLRNTDNAILCNVGIATTGFDDPSVEGTIVNKSTLSLPLWKQMTGRSARPYQYPDGTHKQHHIVLDMGDNVIGGGHGEWSDDVDWKHMFHHPKTPKTGVAPSKICPECGCINPASARICRGLVQDFLDPMALMECGFEFPIKAAEEDTVEKDMVLVSKNINVDATIKFFENRKEWTALWDIVRQIAYYAKQELPYQYIDSEEYEEIWEAGYVKIKEWVKKTKHRNNPWVKKECRSKLVDELRNHGFTVNLAPDEVQENEQEFKLEL